jgi:hypothetical protein
VREEPFLLRWGRTLILHQYTGLNWITKKDVSQPPCSHYNNSSRGRRSGQCFQNEETLNDKRRQSSQRKESAQMRLSRDEEERIRRDEEIRMAAREKPEILISCIKLVFTLLVFGYLLYAVFARH